MPFWKKKNNRRNKAAPTDFQKFSGRRGDSSSRKGKYCPERFKKTAKGKW
jgi:hypothetical protein